MSSPTRITLLTDFGTRDGYVAALKGVIANLCPTAIIDDATHDIEPGDVLAAALTFERYWRRYPEGVVHVVVVDPGVGSARRALAVRADERYLIGPDNGVFSRALAGAQQVEAREITSTAILADSVSPTFHGRDVFAPAAAWLAAGNALAQVGPHATHLTRLPDLEVLVHAEGITGQVIHADRFGNLITSIGAEARGASGVLLGSTDVGPVRHTYTDVATGEALALIGSNGLLEIAVRDGSAARRFGAERGAVVVVRR
jgi:S-adenosylmethionine hydrolase